jgi:cation transport regulator
MPYASNADLPTAVRNHLPAHAQDIYRTAFNSAWHRYGDQGPTGQEETAHRIAWGAVKREYRKLGDHWVPIGTPSLTA